MILYYIFDELPPLSERKAVEALSKLPIFFGTVLFALEAVGVVSKSAGISMELHKFQTTKQSH